MSLTDNHVPVVRTFSDYQLAYFEHLISSWHGWTASTGFIMPTRPELDYIVGQLRKAARKTPENRP